MHEIGNAAFVFPCLDHLTQDTNFYIYPFSRKHQSSLSLNIIPLYMSSTFLSSILQLMYTWIGFTICQLWSDPPMNIELQVFLI